MKYRVVPLKTQFWRKILHTADIAKKKKLFLPLKFDLLPKDDHLLQLHHRRILRELRLNPKYIVPF